MTLNQKNENQLNSSICQTMRAVSITFRYS